MIPKPPTCQGCPMYQDGRGFVPDELVGGATTFVLGQNPGETEEREGKPFVGKTGEEMMQTYFPIAGLDRGVNVSIGNTLRCRWRKSNDLPPTKILQAAVAHCQAAHLRVPPSTRLIVSQGAVAWSSLGGPHPISGWRGYLAPNPYVLNSKSDARGYDDLGVTRPLISPTFGSESVGEGRESGFLAPEPTHLSYGGLLALNQASGVAEVPVLGTLHLADLYRDPKMALATMNDWEKVKRFHAGEWPLPFPAVNTDPRKVVWDDGMAFDTEYSYDPKDKSKPTFMLRFSSCGPSGVNVIERSDSWKVPTSREAPSIVVQNAIGAADLDHLETLSMGPPAHVDDLLLADAVLWSDWPHDLEYLASVYSPYPKTKHLSKVDPVTYAAGDAVDTAWIWHHAIKPQLDADPQSRYIYETRMLPLIPILRRSAQTGIRVDRERAFRATEDLGQVCLDASSLAVAAVGYPLNLGSPLQVVKQLNQDGVKIKSVQHHEVIEAIRKYPDNDLLKARLRWSQADGFRRFVAPIAERSRVYPSFLPTQATGRISVTDPPLVGFPDDGKAQQRGLPALRAIFVPDPGTWWFCWDWSAMHARFLAASAQDELDLRAFDRGWDIHLITACQVFKLNFPPCVTNVEDPRNDLWRHEHQWQKGDRRRHLVKTVRYSLLNGLDYRAVRESTEAIEQGLDMRELESVARIFMATKTSWATWKRSFASQAVRVGEARSLYGRRRRLLGASFATRAKAALSGFYQMTEVDIMTETLIEACRRFPECHLVYPSHDGIKLQFPDSTSVERVYRDLKPWVERPHTFGSATIPLPAEFEVVHPDGEKGKLS